MELNTVEVSNLPQFLESKLNQEEYLVQSGMLGAKWRRVNGDVNSRPCRSPL
jgi:hypothetical protein